MRYVSKLIYPRLAPYDSLIRLRTFNRARRLRPRITRRPLGQTSAVQRYYSKYISITCGGVINMKSCILLSVVFIQLGWTYGDPAPAGVGAYAYQDSAGNRYGGTYGLDDAKEYASKGKPIGPGNRGTADPWGNFADAQAFSGGFGGGWPNFAPYQQNFQQYDDFFPEYFNNLQTLLNDFRRTFTSTWEDDDPFEPLQRLMPFRPFEPLKPLPPLPPLIPFQPLPPLPPLEPLFPPLQRSARFLPPLPPLSPLKPLFPRLKPLRPFKRAFSSNFENQKLAYNAARKAFDLTSNQAGYIPNFTSRLNNFNFGGFPPFGMPMPMGPNSAFAGAAAGPGFTHQVAALNPENPSEPNVNVMSRFGEDVPRAGRGKYVSVSSSSFSSSSNVNGKEKTHKAAETYVNNNGKVTHYRVES